LMSAKGMKTVADLRGKTIGITGIGGMGEFTVVESLRRNGLVKDRDFTVLNIEGGPAARIAALKTNKVQAVPLTPGQRVQIESEGYPVLLDTRDSLPGVPRREPRESRALFARAGESNGADPQGQRQGDRDRQEPGHARRSGAGAQGAGLLRRRPRHPAQTGKHRGAVESDRHCGAGAKVLR